MRKIENLNPGMTFSKRFGAFQSFYKKMIFANFLHFLEIKIANI